MKYTHIPYTYRIKKTPKSNTLGVTNEYVNIGRTNYYGPQNRLCMTCGKCGAAYTCCGVDTLTISCNARAPRIIANRKAWKKFCRKFNIDFTQLEFMK